MGLGKAKELVFTGKLVDAHEALCIGLANMVVPAERFIDEALIIANKIGEKPLLALKHSRIAIEQGLHSNLEHIFEIEANQLLICISAQN